MRTSNYRLAVLLAVALGIGVSLAAAPIIRMTSLVPNFGTLSTCTALNEGGLEVDVLSGVATGKRTKLCLCTSDGASAYKWQNTATATLGTTTTCGTE